MLNKLAELACELDKRGYTEHANQVDYLIKKLAKQWAVWVSWPGNEYQMSGSEIHDLYDSEEEARKVADELKEKGQDAEVGRLGLESGMLEDEAKDKDACEMCGEYEVLTKEETGQGDSMMLCKQCKKDYGKK